MGITFIELILLTVVLFIVAHPLFAARSAANVGAVITESGYTDLLYRKESLYTAIKDLDFDYKTGKIDDDDYKVMKAGLESDALELLGRIDNYEKQAPADISSGSSSVSGQKKETAFCHECGASIQRSHKFCSECGTRI